MRTIKYNVGNHLRFTNGRAIYEITEELINSNNQTIYKIMHTNGDFYEVEASDLASRAIKIKMTKKQFASLPKLYVNYPDWTGINPHNKVKDLDGEYWFDIKNYEDLYQISSFGRIKKLQHYCLKDNHELLSPGDYSDGVIPSVVLNKNGCKESIDLEVVAENNLPDPIFRELKITWEANLNKCKAEFDKIKPRIPTPNIDQLHQINDDNLAPGVIFQHEKGVPTNQSYIIKIEFDGKKFYLYLTRIGENREENIRSLFFWKIKSCNISLIYKGELDLAELNAISPQLIEAKRSHLEFAEVVKSIKAKVKSVTFEDLLRRR